MDKQEYEIRLKIMRSKEFYTHILIYGVVVIFATFVWIGMGFGPFWPIWIIVAFAFALALEAFRIGSIPFVNQYFRFLHPDWEEEEVRRILEKSRLSSGDEKL